MYDVYNDMWAFGKTEGQADSSEHLTLRVDMAPYICEVRPKRLIIIKHS